MAVDAQIPVIFRGFLSREMLPIPQAEPEEREAPEESALDKVKKLAAYALTTLGFILLAVAAGLIIHCSIAGFCAQSLANTETLFMCGLAAALGGFTLYNSQYQGELKLSASGLPFTYTIK